MMSVERHILSIEIQVLIREISSLKHLSVLQYENWRIKITANFAMLLKA